MAGAKSPREQIERTIEHQKDLLYNISLKIAEKSVDGNKSTYEWVQNRHKFIFEKELKLANTFTLTSGDEKWENHLSTPIAGQLRVTTFKGGEYAQVVSSYGFLKVLDTHITNLETGKTDEEIKEYLIEKVKDILENWALLMPE